MNGCGIISEIYREVKTVQRRRRWSVLPLVPSETVCAPWLGRNPNSGGPWKGTGWLGTGPGGGPAFQSIFYVVNFVPSAYVSA